MTTPGHDDLRDQTTDELLGEDAAGGIDARAFPAELAEEYEVVRELGRGGMAVVYLARDRELRREVAIKVVQAQYVANAEVLQRFAREARMVAGLSHPNIVTLYSVRKLADNSLALIMQYVPGETLQQALEREGAFSFNRARQVLADIAQALGYAHARGIVHRDVKPENVFIDARTGQAMLSDFGIARSGELDPRVTRTNVAIGTPAYMSPEQIDGHTVDGRSDLYSLGLVGWELLAGQQPWHGESLYGVIYRQKHDELPPLDEIRRETPPELIAAVEGALEKQAGVRWPRAEDFLDVLTGRVPPPPRRPRRPERRERPPVNTHDFVLPPELANLPTVAWRRGEPTESAADPGALVPSGEPAAARDDEPRPDERRDALAAMAAGVTPTAAPRAPQRRRRVGLLAVLGAAALSIGFATNEWQRREGERPTRVATADSAPTLAIRVRPETAGGEIAAPGGGLAAPSDFDSSELADSSAGDDTTQVADSAPEDADDSTAAGDSAGASVAAADSEPAATVGVADSQGARPPVLPTRARGGATTTVVRTPAESAAGNGRVGPAAGGEIPAAPGVALPDAPVAAAPLPTAPSGGAPSAGGGGDAATGDAVLAASSAAVATLAPGGSHTCQIAADGTALCWGQNNRGQLGDGTSERRTAPTATATELRFVNISAGLSHTCGVASSGGVYCWGANDLGQLGDGTLSSHDTPTRVKAVTRVRAVESANAHSCALTFGGEAYCWGSNASGELGVQGGAVARSTPVRVPTTSRFSLLALGWNHTCALTSGGQAVCWGQGTRGQLGDGTTAEQRGPAPVSANAQFASLAAGSSHSCGVSTDGRAFCWGANNFGQLGDGGTTDRASPVEITVPARFVRVTAGSVHSCALTGGGAAYCWGRNAYGQLGDGTQVDRSTPVRVQSREPFVALRASGSHTCATTASRRNVCWGYNLNGQLGDGTRYHRSRPVAVTVGG